MRRWALTLEYDGSAFAGWQVQPGCRTVQGTLEAALERLLGHPVRVLGAGRTDAGVHALGQVATFATDRDFDAATIRRALNALTPPELAVLQVEEVPATFDPRRAATRRLYRYLVWNRPVPSPFWRRYAWHVREPLDVDAMTRAAETLVGEHDFSAFRASGCEARSPVRRVLRSAVARREALVTYEIEAVAFLRHMVRNIVGTLAEVGRGARRPEDIPALLAGRDRTAAGVTAPAHGLYLVRVTYAPGEADPERA